MPRDAPGVSPVDEVAGLTGQVAALTRELATQERRSAEAEAAARARIEALADALSAVEGSTTWRATAPLRAFGAKLPEPLRMAIRRLARHAYWAVTPHRIPFRLRWFTFNPLDRQISARLAALSAEVRERLGPPLRCAYGPSEVEKLDVYRTAQPDAPIFVFVHGGAWRAQEGRVSGFPAEMFVAAGAHFVVLDFIGIKEAGGDPRIIAEQVRRGVAWIYRNATSFGGDRERLFVGGHSSGGHLCAVALLTDWQRDFGLPVDLVKGGLLMSGLYDLGPMRRDRLNPLFRFTDEIEQAMSPQRHLNLLRAPVIVTCGSKDSPAFREQSRAFFEAVVAAGKPAELIEAAHLGHMDAAEALGNPYSVNGRAALHLMGLRLPPAGER